jgi:hypothetical protein
MVHNFFSNIYLDKPYKILGKVLNKDEIKKMLTNSRLKVLRSFGDIIKIISKNKIGKFIHRMSSLNPMNAPSLAISSEVIAEAINVNLKGFDLDQGI